MQDASEANNCPRVIDIVVVQADKESFKASSSLDEILILQVTNLQTKTKI